MIIFGQMIKALFPLLSVFVPLWLIAQPRKTELIVIGNIHQPVPNYNSDTLLSILEQIRPDLILHEVDSSFFTKDFKFNNPSDGNEQQASEKYVARYPLTKIRPFEFEGRNKYRIEQGMRPTDGLTLELLDNLYRHSLLTAEHQQIVSAYHQLTDSLKEIATHAPRHFNNTRTDSIAQQRQRYQYQEISKIVAERDEFADAHHTKPNGQKISYRDGYLLWADFWDLRNKTMAKNIMKHVHRNPNRRIVVLTGFLHRYYLLNELKKFPRGENVLIKEFYDYF